MRKLENLVLQIRGKISNFKKRRNIEYLYEHQFIYREIVEKFKKDPFILNLVVRIKNGTLDPESTEYIEITSKMSNAQFIAFAELTSEEIEKYGRKKKSS